MAKYHFNPSTGEPGQCKAEHACPFGLALDSHYGSLREAASGAEEHLAAQAGGSFGQPEGMVLGFEEWKAQKEAQAKLEAKEAASMPVFVEPTAPVSDYRALMPNGLMELGDQARKLGLDLQETHRWAGKLYANTATSDYKGLMVEALQEHVAEAEGYNASIDQELEKSFYFKKPQVRRRKSGTVIETYGEHENLDLITRVDENGKASFEVYDRDELESDRSNDPSGWPSTIGNWTEHFKLYQDHLYLRARWQKEADVRASRAQTIRERIGA